MVPVFVSLGKQLRIARRRRAMSQHDLAYRVGRDKARISELERDLSANRMGRDRLTLLADLCDALDLVPLLVPKGRLVEAKRLLDPRPPGSAPRVATVFDDVFVDLDERGARDE